ncbi:hypothetical protein LTR84_009073 [Exophiala bonariae]|uniref:CENP-V/GFA domain-containing protein n=1 Tax=Exophiala bonariae TaxID=1690606 RepID=A0AAV9MVL7_9EURO|nr:hypothetical protein LTR84_009073 [Exophiala bonariae]
MASPPSKTVPLTVRCHCEKVSLNVEIPQERFPLESSICHCRSCRHATGQIFTTFANIPTDIPSELLQDDHNNLTTYRSSSTLLRLFCKSCGASIANFDSAYQDEWGLATGCIKFAGDPLGHEGRLNRIQIWLDDVRSDGGAAVWINAGTSVGMDRHWRGRGSGTVSDSDVQDILTGDSSAQESEQAREAPSLGRNNTLDGRCHCGTISFTVSQPDEQHNHGTGKFEASLDACTSCRLVTGFEITSWATVPQDLIKTTASSFNAYLADRSKLNHYKSSQDVSRYFCTKCGATIFYQNHGLATIDIAIGILDPSSNEQARAEDWLLWQKYPKAISYPEDAVDRKLVQGLADGLRLHMGELKG